MKKILIIIFILLASEAFSADKKSPFTQKKSFNRGEILTEKMVFHGIPLYKGGKVIEEKSSHYSRTSLLQIETGDSLEKVYLFYKNSAPQKHFEKKKEKRIMISYHRNNLNRNILLEETHSGTRISLLAEK